MRRFTWLASWCFLAVLMGTVTVTDLPGQDKKKVTEEEEESKPANKPPAKADAPKTTQTPKKEEEEDKPKNPPPSKSLGATVNLADEAKKVPAPLQKIMQDLATPYDIVTMASGRVFKVDPLPQKYDGATDGSLTVNVIPEGNQAPGRQNLQREGIAKVSQYELRAQEEVKKLLNSNLDQAGGAGKPAISRYQVLRVAEMVLNNALNFHKSAKASGGREADPKNPKKNTWGNLEQELANEVRRLQVAEVLALIGERDWANAAELADQLHKADRGSRDVYDVLDKVYVGQAEVAIAKNDYPKAKERIDYLLKTYNPEVSTGVQKVQGQLQDRAREIFKEAKELSAKGQSGQAMASFEMANRIWPALEGLAEEVARIAKTYQRLRIGVRHLPTQMSPTTAETDADRLAVQLLFDHLFELRAGPSIREGYSCKLGAAINAIPQGYEITLPNDVKWSDGKPLTSADVLRSMQIVMDPASPYYDPLAKDLVTVAPIDPYRLTITLNRGYIDPLSLMTFPILPKHLLLEGRSPRNLSFGKQPVGTGPYVFQGIDGREMIFAANPNYHRPHCPDGPSIKEIRIVEYTDFATAREGLASGTYHLLLDLTTKEMEQLSGLQQATVVTATEPREPAVPYLANPSVYVLLPNCRKPPFSSTNMRLAVGLSIDREGILNKLFRGTGAKKYHQTLNGPFPLGSWAYNPQLDPSKSPPFKPDLGKARLQDGKNEAGSFATISLKHPAEDLTAAGACNAIKADLEKNLGLTIKVEAVPFQKLMGEMTSDRPDFDLIYWRYDFDNETLSLWPLFDPNGMGANGRNYVRLGAVSEIEGKFREIQNRRDLPYVRQQSHILHDTLTQKYMVPIPLWQLDKHAAVHKSVVITRINPIYAVEDVEEWRMSTK